MNFLDTRRLRWLPDLASDFRYATRAWLRVPAFTITSIVTIALSVGATSAMFSLLDALLLRPLPVADPYRLINIASLEKNGVHFALPGPVLKSLRKDPLLAGVCGVQTPLSNVTINEETFPVGAHALTGDCYSTLGVHAALGRLLTSADDLPNGPRVAVISYDFWQNRFAASPAVLGQTIRIEGEPFTIIGVTQRQFRGLLLGFPPAVSFPISQLGSGGNSGKSVFYWTAVLARLRPGVSIDQVRAKLRSEWPRLLDNALPSDRFNGTQRNELVAMPPLVNAGANGLDFSLRDRFRQPLAGLLVISVLALLVACMNLANLLLARGLERRHEIAIRLALGAKRARIARQLISESLLLMLVGFGLALILSTVADRLLLAALSSSYVGLSIDMTLNSHVLTFTALCSLVALLLFGVLPAWQTSDIDSAANLKASSRSVTAGRLQSRRLLISGQIALTMILVMAASAFIQSLQKMRHQNLGFETQQILDAQLLPLPGRLVQKSAALAYFQNFLDGVRQLHGVQSASLSSFSPLFTRPYKEDVRRLDLSDSPVVEAPAEFVSDGFLQTLRIPILRGTDFTLRSATDSQKTAIVSESLAIRLFGHAEPLGRHIRFGSEPETRDLQVIGVVADARLEDPRGPDLGFLYLNLWQLPDRAAWGNLQLRYSGAAGPLIIALKKSLQQQGRQYSRQIRGVSEQFELSILQERLLAALGTSFGLLGLLLAALGLFGLLSFFVAARKSEIGVRMALGAQSPAICWMVVREACILAGTGILIGLPFCLATSRALKALVPNITAMAFAPLALTCFILILVTALATIVPVYLVSTIDPVNALRVE